MSRRNQRAESERRCWICTAASRARLSASGAYGLTYSNLKFLSHPAPTEILVDQGRSSVIRERGKPVDALAGQLLPPRT